MLALPNPNTSPSGGQGGRAPSLSREDLRMTGQAIRGRWPIRPEKRQHIIDVLTTIATSPGMCGPRESIAAAKALLDADRINQEDELRQVKAPAELVAPDGTKRLDFSHMTDQELDAWVQANQ